MSRVSILPEVSRALRTLLWEAWKDDPALRAIAGSQDAIVFSSPAEAARGPAARLSLWLYRVTEDGFLKNQPVTRDEGRVPAPGTPPALVLSYLVTPCAASVESNYLLLGGALRALRDNAVVLLRDASGQTVEELRITPQPLSLEELARLWEALREPYRLSLSYQVRVMRAGS